MSAIYPFAALRPAPKPPRAVAAVPYDVVSSEEARALAAGNPLSFLPRVAGGDRPPAAARSARRCGLRTGRREPSRPASAGAARRGRSPRPSTSIACTWERTCRPASPRAFRSTSTTRPDQEAREDAARQGRRSHAAHARDRRADRSGVPHLSRLEGGRRHRRRVATPARRCSTSPPRTACATRSGRCRPRSTRRSSTRSRRSTALYIADGHHRAASAARTRAALWRAAAPGEHDRVLAVAFPDNQMQVLPYNRVVKDLNGMTPESSSSVSTQHGDGQRPPARRRRKGRRRRCISTASGTRSTRRAAARATSGCGARRRACCRTAMLAAAARHQGRAHRQAHRLRRRHSRHRGARAAGELRRSSPWRFRCIRSRSAT